MGRKSRRTLKRVDGKESEHDRGQATREHNDDRVRLGLGALPPLSRDRNEPKDVSYTGLSTEAQSRSQGAQLAE